MNTSAPDRPTFEQVTAALSAQAASGAAPPALDLYQRSARGTRRIVRRRRLARGAVTLAAIGLVIAAVALWPEGRHGLPVATGPDETTASTPATADPPPCDAGQLTLGLGYASTSANPEILTLRLANTSTATCRIDGYPQASIAGPDGAQIGPNAEPAPSAAYPPGSATLAPGAATGLILSSGTPGSGAPDCLATGTTVRITLPGHGGPLTVEFPFTICGPNFTVAAVADAPPAPAN